jgi:hypothetical protein
MGQRILDILGSTPFAIFIAAGMAATRIKQPSSNGSWVYVVIDVLIFFTVLFVAYKLGFALTKKVLHKFSKDS